MENESKPIDANISFSDASFLSLNYEAQKELLEVLLEAWNEQAVRIRFEGVVCFLYKSGDFISDIIEFSPQSRAHIEIVKKVDIGAETDSLKLIEIRDIDDKTILEVLCQRLRVI